MAGVTPNVWQDIEIRINQDPFFKSWQMSSMNKKVGSKKPLKPKAPFKWVFMDTIPETSRFVLTSETTFSSYLLTVDAN